MKTLRSLSINLFFKCNAKCLFCVVGVTGGERATGEFSLAEVKEVLSEGHENGCQRVTFCGGEPTIYPGLPDAVRYARDLGYRGIEIKTNGIRLSSTKYTRDLADAGVNNFSISIHGPDAVTHDRLVGVPGAFSRALKGAQIVKEIGSRLSLPTCIQQENFHQLPETILLLVNLSPDFCLPTFIEPSGSAAFRFETVVPWYSEVRPFLSTAVAILEEHPNVQWALHGFPMCMLRGFERHSYDLLRADELVGGADNADYFSYEKRMYRVKTDKCQQCNFETICGGPWRGYVERRGWEEFIPISDTRPTAVIPLPKLMRTLLAVDLARC